MTNPFLVLALTATLPACGSVVPGEVAEQSAALHAEAVVCPGSSTVFGIDVFYCALPTINWSAVKSAGVQFVILREGPLPVCLGDGASNFATAWRDAKAAGLVVGASAQSRSAGTPEQWADSFVDMLNGVGYGAGDLPPSLDTVAGRGVTVDRINAWLQRVESRTGRNPILYTTPVVWGALPPGSTPNPLPYLWFGQQGVTCPTLPLAWSNLSFWLYSETGTLPGISGKVDLDLFNGPLMALHGL
jgi:lysozyme